jgi:hypothetical protein
MLKPVVEQCSNKSVNVYLGEFHFKLSSKGPQERPEWTVSTDKGFEPVTDRKVRKWLNRLWVRKIHCASRPPDPIPRFPRKISEDVKKLLVSAERANHSGNLEKLARISEKLRFLAMRPQETIDRWKDLPLASEAPEQKLKWLAEARIPYRQVTVIAASKDTYKSMLMLALAKAATTDGSFLDKRVRQLHVIYQNRDMPKAVFDDYCRTLQIDKSNPRFKILSSMWDTKIQPMQPDDPLLLRFARRYKPLIIFDYLAKFYKGNLEKPKAIDEFMETLKQLTVLGATVIILHHVPKNDATSEGFGSIYIINGADFGWNIARKGGLYASGQSSVVRIQNTKTKMGDYFNLKVRPRLKQYGKFEVISEKSEEQEKWDRAVEKFKALFPGDDWIEKRELQDKAKSGGFSRQKFKDVFAFCLDGGSIFVKNEKNGRKLCRLIRRVQGQ